MELSEIRRRMDQGTENLWWTYRFVEAVIQRVTNQKAITEDDVARAVDGFLRLAMQDPDWANEVLAEFGPVGYGYGLLLSEERLDAGFARLKLPSTAADAMLRARMLCACAKSKLGKANTELWRRAWEQLLRVPKPQRDQPWKDTAMEPAGMVSYADYRELAVEHLSSMTRDFERSMFLPDALAIAARHRDWPTFENWLAAWRVLPESLRRGHAECAIASLEGVRALDEGRLGDAEAAMRRLLEMAMGAQFLSNDEIKALPKRLREEGRLAQLCDAFDELVQRRDWRLLKS